jgi:hypothetical protein
MVAGGGNDVVEAFEGPAVGLEGGTSFASTFVSVGGRKGFDGRDVVPLKGLEPDTGFASPLGTTAGVYSTSPSRLLVP